MPDETLPLHFAFIINPKAGRMHLTDLGDKINAFFKDKPQGHTAEVLLTGYGGHASELAHELAERYGRRLVCFACGGDGTAQEVANGIAGTDSAMSILPIGTANDFARAALSTSNVDSLLGKVLQPQIRPIDIINVDGRICLNIASLGFDTKVQKIAAAINAKFRWLGSLSYPFAIVVSLFGNRAYPMHFKLETVDSQGQPGTVESDATFILAAICNGRYYGGGFNPAPMASLDDGLLEFCLVDSLPLKRILPLIPLYKKGRHLGDPAVHCWQVTGGSITAADGDLMGNLDGETFARPSISFKIIPKGLRFAFY